MTINKKVTYNRQKKKNLFQIISYTNAKKQQLFSNSVTKPFFDINRAELNVTILSTVE